MVDCSDKLRKAEPERPLILLIDFEDLERSSDKRKLIESVLEEKSCEKLKSSKSRLHLFICTSAGGNVRHLVILFEGGPERVLEKLSTQASNLLRDPKVVKLLKDRRVVQKVKQGQCSKNDKVCVLLHMLAREVEDLLGDFKLERL